MASIGLRCEPIRRGPLGSALQLSAVTEVCAWQRSFLRNRSRRHMQVFLTSSLVLLCALGALWPPHLGSFVGAWLPALTLTRRLPGKHIGVGAIPGEDAFQAEAEGHPAEIEVRPMSGCVTKVLEDLAIISVPQTDGTEIEGELHISQLPQRVRDIHEVLEEGMRLTVYERPQVEGHQPDAPRDGPLRFSCFPPSATLTPRSMPQWRDMYERGVTLKGTIIRADPGRGSGVVIVQVQHPVSGMVVEGLLPSNRQGGLYPERGMELDVRVLKVDEMRCRLKFELDSGWQYGALRDFNNRRWRTGQRGPRRRNGRGGSFSRADMEPQRGAPPAPRRGQQRRASGPPGPGRSRTDAFREIVGH